MPTFSAALFMTSPRPFGDEESLSAHAFLFEGSKPYWTVNCTNGQKVFVPSSPSYILEDGLVALMEFYRLSEKKGEKLTEEEAQLEFMEDRDEAELQLLHGSLSLDLIRSGFNFRLVNWPGSSLERMETRLAELLNEDKLLNDMKQFVDRMNDI
jgi:hypothetical protein